MWYADRRGRGRLWMCEFFLILRASIDLPPDHSSNGVLDRGRETHVLSDSPQNDESGFSFPHTTVPAGTPGVGIQDRPSVTTSSAVHFPHEGDARQRRSTRQTDSGYSGTRPSLDTRAITSVLSTSRGNSPIILRDPAIGSSHQPSDLSDEGQLRAESSSP